jgi:hypothetical protein
MGRLFKIVTSSVWLLLAVVLLAQPANAQKRYPAIEDPWDGTDYRAVIERIEKDGLELPTISNAATKPVFERMVAGDNIPLRSGLNKNLPVTIRFQKLDSALDPVHKLVAIYMSEAQKGKSYAPELARLMVYESKISAAMLELSDPMIATLDNTSRYHKAQLAEFDKMKNTARDLYSRLVKGATDPRAYSKPEILAMIGGAMDGLRSYHTVLTNDDRQQHIQKLTQQISATSDAELKKAMTELRDAIEHKRVRT